MVAPGPAPAVFGVSFWRQWGPPREFACAGLEELCHSSPPTSYYSSQASLFHAQLTISAGSIVGAMIVDTSYSVATARPRSE